MKTTITKTVKCLAFMLMVFTLSALQAKGSVTGFERALKDTTYKIFSGKVIDSETRKPIVYANVYLVGSSLGVVTNADGEFILKVPLTELERKLGISNIGYKTYEVRLADLKEQENVIRLQTEAVQVGEVIVRSDDPLNLVRMAIKRVNENYKTDPEMQVGFYRETVKQNKSYIAVSEAVLDVYKASYSSLADYDRVRIFKGRKSDQVKKMDTLMFKLQGGPRTSFLLDVVKNPGALFTEEYLDDYYYSNSGYANIDGRPNYVIAFAQKESVEDALYKGLIYLDTENLAFSRIEFSFSDQALNIADNELVRKKPLDLKVDVLAANYLINYRNLDGKWYLNHVRSELVFDCIWKKRRYNSTYTAVLEMAVTDRTENINKARYRDQAKMTDIFADQVSLYKDENFWGDYNYIKPDESIEAVINRLSRKLKWENITEE